MARLNLIQYADGKYGLEELDDDGLLSNLYDSQAQPIAYHKALGRSYQFIRALVDSDQYDLESPEDFGMALVGVEEIVTRQEG